MSKKSLAIAAIVATALVACADNQKPAESPSNTATPTTTTGGTTTMQTTSPSDTSKATSTVPNNSSTASANPPPTEIPAPSADRSNATSNNGNNGTNAVNSNSHDANNAQTPSTSGASLTAMDQGNSDSERRITADIRKTVVGDRALSFSAKNVTIITIGSKVTLKGSVSTAQEKATVERYAKRTAGVTDVDSQLEVKK